MNIALNFFGKLCGGVGGVGKDNINKDIMPDNFIDGNMVDGSMNEENEKLYIMKMPIEYLDKNELHKIKGSVQTDLELFISNVDVDISGGNISTEPAKTVYTKLFSPKNQYTKENLKRWTHYTTSTSFLEDTQRILEFFAYTRDDTLYNNSMALCDSVNECFTFAECDELNETGKIKRAQYPNEYNEIKCNDTFLQKYGYLEWERFRQFNESAEFLQMFAMIQLASPILSFLIPLVLLILPFFILKLQGIHITLDQYFTTLKTIAKHHFIGKALNFSGASFESVSYFAFIAVMYAIQMYQNYRSCTRFYKNLVQINEALIKYKKYTMYTFQCMRQFMYAIKRANVCKKSAYNLYLIDLNEQCIHLEKLAGMLYEIEPFAFSFSTFKKIGYLLKCYYALYNDPTINNTLLYTFEFNGYFQNMLSISNKIQHGFINKCEYIYNETIQDTNNTIETENDDNNNDNDDNDNNDEDTETIENNSEPPSRQYTKIINQTYLFYCDDCNNNNNSNINNLQNDAVKNTIDLSENIIITGVNASGKTTTLKTTAINILFSQQFGYGYYESAQIRPYTYIHSYLNIPDTSGRDSLFQAESRRCKKIIDEIKNASLDKLHFCIFDELYSGTNPTDATRSAYSFLSYLTKHNNVDFILTTHYIQLCEKMDTIENIKNMQMEILIEEELEKDTTIKYTYKLIDGICKVEGGIEILKMLDYPKEIIETIEEEKFLNK